jgi:hypothetical protein
VFPAPVTGLPIGGQVLFNGIPIGNVSALDFDPENPKVVVATVRVKPNTPLRKDTKASLNFQGLTGVAYVDLNGGSLKAPLLIQPRGRDRAGHACGTLPVRRYRRWRAGCSEEARIPPWAPSTRLLKDNGPSITKTIQQCGDLLRSAGGEFGRRKGLHGQHLGRLRILFDLVHAHGKAG